MKILNLPIDLPQDACCKARPDQSADLTAYLLDPMAETASRLRPAVVICPGGGYTRLSEREDQPVAMEYLAAGFQVFSLHYSVAPDVFPRALMELALAVRLIRLNSAKWHVDPEKIVVSGFSAGGHLACCLGVFYNRDFLCGPLKTSPEQIRPDGLLLCYPVITSGPFCHPGSIESLLGPDARDQEKRRLPAHAAHLSVAHLHGPDGAGGKQPALRRRPAQPRRQLGDAPLPQGPSRIIPSHPRGGGRRRALLRAQLPGMDRPGQVLDQKFRP